MHCYAFFFAVCMQAMTHSVANVPSQQAVKLVVIGPVFVDQCWFGLFLGDQWQWKMEWIVEMALKLVTLALKFFLKMRYFPDQWGELHFCYLRERRFYQMGTRIFKNFFLSRDFTFSVRRGIKLPISARLTCFSSPVFKKPVIGMFSTVDKISHFNRL